MIEVASIFKDNIYTDIPVQSLPAFVTLVERVQKSKITSVSLTSAQQDYFNPDYTLIRQLIGRAHAEGHVSAPMLAQIAGQARILLAR